MLTDAQTDTQTDRQTHKQTMCKHSRAPQAPAEVIIDINIRRILIIILNGHNYTLL